MSEFNNKDLSKDPIDTKIYLRNFRPNKGFYVLDDAYFKQVRAVLNYRVASPLSVIIHSFTDFNGTGLPIDTDADKPVFMDYVLLSNPLNGNVIAKPYISALFTKYTLTYSTKGLINKTITLTKDSAGLWSSSDETIAIDNRGVLTLPYAKVKGYSQVIATIYANDGRTNTSELLIRKLINPPSLSQDIGKTITVTVADTSEVGDKTVVYLTDKDNKNFTVTLIKKLDTSWVSDNVDLIPNIEANKNSTVIAVDKLLIGSYVKATTLMVTDKVYLSKPVQIKVLQKIGCTPTEYVFKNNAPATGVVDGKTALLFIGMQLNLNGKTLNIPVIIDNSPEYAEGYTDGAVFNYGIGSYTGGNLSDTEIKGMNFISPFIGISVDQHLGKIIKIGGFGENNQEMKDANYLKALFKSPIYKDNPQQLQITRFPEEAKQKAIDAYAGGKSIKFIDYIDMYHSGEDIIVMSCQELTENTGDSGNVGGGGSSGSEEPPAPDPEPKPEPSTTINYYINTQKNTATIIQASDRYDIRKMSFIQEDFKVSFSRVDVRFLYWDAIDSNKNRQELLELKKVKAIEDFKATNPTLTVTAVSSSVRVTESVDAATTRIKSKINSKTGVPSATDRVGFEKGAEEIWDIAISTNDPNYTYEATVVQGGLFIYELI